MTQTPNPSRTLINIDKAAESVLDGRINCLGLGGITQSIRHSPSHTLGCLDRAINQPIFANRGALLAITYHLAAPVTLTVSPLQGVHVALNLH